MRLVTICGMGLALSLGGCNRPCDCQNTATAPAAEVGKSVIHAKPATATETPDTVGADGEQADLRSIMRPSVLPELADPIVEPSEPEGLVLSFAQGEKGLPEGAEAKLETLLATKAVQEGGAITISGHTDSRGDDRANLRVSKRRAGLVRDWLRARGVAADRITVYALGETRPVAPNARPDGSDDPEGRAQNRRVEIAVMRSSQSSEAESSSASSGPDRSSETERNKVPS